MTKIKKLRNLEKTSIMPAIMYSLIPSSLMRESVFSNHPPNFCQDDTMVPGVGVCRLFVHPVAYIAPDTHGDMADKCLVCCAHSEAWQCDLGNVFFRDAVQVLALSYHITVELERQVPWTWNW